jgi:hypothetical protein
LKTKATVFFETSVLKNRHGHVCQETVIFTSTSGKTSIFALFYSVLYFVSVFINNLCILSQPSLFLTFFLVLCLLFLTTYFCVFIGVSSLLRFRFYYFFLSEILSFQVFYFIFLSSFVYLCIFSSKTFTALPNTSECKTCKSISRIAGSRRLYFQKDFTCNIRTELLGWTLR